MGKEFNIEDYLKYINDDVEKLMKEEINKLPKKYQKLKEILDVNDEDFLDLLDIKDNWNIEEKDFFEISIFAKRYLLMKMGNNYKLKVPDSLLCEIIKESLLGIDYDINEEKKLVSLNDLIGKNKSREEAFIRAIKAIDY